MPDRKPHRQICDLCNGVCYIDFSVPNKTWKLALHRTQLNKHICIWCFAKVAEERGADWSTGIILKPLSRVAFDLISKE